MNAEPSWYFGQSQECYIVGNLGAYEITISRHQDDDPEDNPEPPYFTYRLVGCGHDINPEDDGFVTTQAAMSDATALTKAFILNDLDFTPEYEL